mmetsp:Transcript_18758/g.44843  ORF Transcript_18758/g.44843 Transcript_18758/m.44843 type:complete len:149 (+) Transcript_18758:251-697(+)
MDGRHSWIISKISESRGVDAAALQSQFKPLRSKVDEFFKPSGPPAIVFFYQVPEAVAPDGERLLQGTTPKLMLASSEVLRGPEALLSPVLLRRLQKSQVSWSGSGASRFLLSVGSLLSALSMALLVPFVVRRLPYPCFLRRFFLVREA